MNNRRKELMLASAREYCKCVVEGKTLRYNQLVQVNRTTTTQDGITFTVNADKSITCNGTASADTTFFISTAFDLKAQHKYILCGCAKNGSTTSYMLRGYYLTDDIGNGSYTLNATNRTNCYVYIQVQNGTVLNNITFKPMLIDLTALGLGNINSVADFFATDLGKYIAKGNYLPYETEGKFINTTSPLYFKGRNMLSLARTQGTLSGFTNTTPRDFKENEYYLVLTMNNYYNNYTTYFEISREKVVIETSGSGYGVAFPIKVKPNTNYTLKFNATDNRYRIGWYNELGVFLSYSDNITGNFTSPNNAYWGVVVLAPSENVRTTYTDIMFCEASDYQSKYEPYCSTQVFENGLTLQKGDKYKSYSVDSVEYNQIIKNGNFANGTDDWTTNAGTVTAENNVATFTATAQSGDLRTSVQTDIVIGHKYLISVDVKVATAPGTDRICVYFGYNSPAGAFVPNNANWNTIRNVVTSTNQGTGYLLFIRDFRSTRDAIYVKNVMVIDLTALGLTNVNSVEDFNKTKLGMFLSKGYYLPYTTTAKTIKDQLTRTMKEINLSTLTWLNNDDSLYALLPSGFKTFEYSDTQTIIAEKYPTGTNNGQIYITNVGGFGYCIRIEGGYTLGITPSGKALCEMLKPELIEYYVVRITNPTFEYVSGNIKKSTLAYDFDIFKVGNVPQVFVPIMASPNYLTPKTYAQMEQTAETCAYRPSDKHIYINTQYEVNSTQKTIIYMIIPTRMVSRRTIDVESGNDIDLDFTKE